MFRQHRKKFPRRNRRRRGMVTPSWAPHPLDISLSDVSPLPGWVVVKEEFEQDRRVTVAGVELEIASPGISNTVIGEIAAIHPEDHNYLGVQVGDMIVYREWHGSRWDFAGEIALVMEREHILGLVA